ncbi:hypothetical protein PCIT_a1623 [Pseudoalteromonas citrea]|uniref:Uncharacterized protein n=1 Tax=Pseudoalteromonas citrea TaxID=43655 RepID=A0AAD4AMK6_9GAMM|nr:hypothetical protein PCIT_a1623 [Pseudoalteromonas citrea]
MAGLYARFFKLRVEANGKRSLTVGWFYTAVGGALRSAF